MGGALAAGAPGWRYACASVAGTAHGRSGIPCQDHAGILPLPGALAAVACDGAGSALHAAEGARAACQAFLEFVRAAGPDPAAPDWFAAEALAAVQDRVGALAQAQGWPVRDYACTLLGALVLPDRAVFLQLGDGAIAYRDGWGGPWRRATQAHRGEFANETVFVTAGDAALRLSVACIAGPVREFALMTDGVEFLAIRQAGAQPHAPFFEHVMQGLRGEAAAGASTSHAAWLTGFLSSDAVNRRTDDDKTLALASLAP